MLNRSSGFALALALALALVPPLHAQSKKPVTLLNVSYDPTRELFEEYNKAFAKYWLAKAGQVVTVRQSHGGSSKQARTVIDGLQADVVTLALAYDIDALADRGRLVPANWMARLPDNSAPYTSTIVFLVRKGNPKKIKDWDDLTRNNVAFIVANPKTSGAARWAYLAAWGYASRKYHKDETKIRDFMSRLYSHVPVLDSGARGATTTFIERGIGDVLVNWENEAMLALREFGGKDYEIVRPQLSILAEPSVALVDKVVDRKKTRAVADAYLRYLYSDEGQHIVARNFYRPRSQAVAARYAAQFPKMELFSVSDFGTWREVQAKHFNDGGTFDQIYRPH